MQQLKIAVLLTCYNRKEKTVACLNSLNRALDSVRDRVNVEVFLTDDGCTDGTSDAVKNIFPSNLFHIIKGNGNLFWAGGMRVAWNEALKRHNEWDYYLLINDDVKFLPNVSDELFKAEEFSKTHYGKEGICSGLTCDTNDANKITYGGGRWKNRFLASTETITYNGEPQACDFTNANILLVPKYVVDKIGIFHKGYHHGKADYDYTCVASNKGIPVLLTGNAVGKCDNDHIKYAFIARKVVSMSLKERKVFYKKPINSIDDYLLFVRRTSPIRYPWVALGRYLNLYFPKFYYKIKGIKY